MLLFGCPVRSVSALGRRLFVVGRSSLLSGPCVSVAGSRRGVAPASTEWLRDMLRGVHNHSVVSGLALGIDRAAHECALELGLPTIAVLPSGFARIAPRQHLDLARRIVPQCEAKSGTMHTVRFARALNRPVFTRRAEFSGNSYIVSSLGGYYK